MFALSLHYFPTVGKHDINELLQACWCGCEASEVVCKEQGSNLCLLLQWQPWAALLIHQLHQPIK
jgi:hypothetical protein